MWREGLARLGALYRTLALKIILLAAVFLIVPIILYRLFQIGDAQQSELLQRAAAQQDNLITLFLQPHLEAFKSEPPDALQKALNAVVLNGMSVKVLVRPQPSNGPQSGGAPGAANSAQGFLYVASAPAVSSAYLENERAALIRLGVFDKLAQSCNGGIKPTAQFTSPSGEAEVLTSVHALHIDQDCWVIVTSEATRATLSAAIGQPIWRSPAAQIAGVVYLLSALLVAWLFLDIWRNLRRFRKLARTIRMGGASGLSFRKMNSIPELKGVADDFNSLVAALNQSKDFILRAAEENAHALKAPLAVIAQAIEPLKRAVRPADRNAQRSLELIERSTVRLDALVSSARDLEEAAVEAIYPNLRQINLSACLTRLVSAFEPALAPSAKRLTPAIAPNIHIYGTEEAIEDIVENLLENAASFIPPGGVIEVSLRVAEGLVHLDIADNGPGVAAADLPRIFERNFSARNSSPEGGAGLGEQHYGLGLWIARRNVEALGGNISARNRMDGGFAVAIRFDSLSKKDRSEAQAGLVRQAAN